LKYGGALESIGVAERRGHVVRCFLSL